MSEEKSSPSTYFERVWESWQFLVTRFGWLAVVWMFYRVNQTGLDFETGIFALLVGAGSASAIGFVVALVIAGVTGIDKRRLEACESSGDVLKLLGFIHSSGMVSSWKAGCAALVRVGKPAVPLLLEAVDTETCPVRNVIGRTLPSSPGLRAGAAYCLGQLKEESAVTPLIISLSDENWSVRFYAAQALGEIGAKGALDDLKTLTRNESHPEVQKAVKEAMEKIQTSHPQAVTA